MAKKELIAMLLAGGQGSRLGVLTANKAKPSVAFGGKYKIIDFPMSNCINSGIDTVGVLTQYQPTSLNKHIGIGSSWDLDCQSGGVSILSPYYKGDKGEWYTGTANAIYHNIDYINSFNPEYVLILSGDHIYKMDYSDMLNCHKKNSADVTIAVIEVPIEEASRYGIMNLNDNDRIDSFEEKPEVPKSNLASMGIYIFTWKKLKEALIQDKIVHSDSDFGKHIIPYMLENKSHIFAYRFNDYWKDVGTVEAYWSANIDLIKIVPEFNLYDDFWNIYTNSVYQPPQFLGEAAIVKNSLVSDGCYVYGSVTNSILGTEVIIGKNCEIYDCVIMSNCTIGDNTKIYKSIIDENSIIGQNVTIGVGEALPNSKKPDVYSSGITVIGENSVIPDDITIGINCVIHGVTEVSHYKDKALESGGTIMDIEVVL